MKTSKTNVSVYSLCSLEGVESNHVTQLLSILNRGYADRKSLATNRHLDRKVRALLPRGNALVKRMGKMGYRPK